ncbi:MAG TPA: CcdB family protein [Burkholderiaceae bacterium]|nr:CcdB family protein [Burkholderiaceae bacterium]
MGQFDVHRNIGKQSVAIPFVVVVQSSLFDRYRRRVVVPLVRKSALEATAESCGSRMNPRFLVEGIEVMLHPLEIVSISVDRLGERVASLSEQGAAIADALDELFTRSWS